MLDEAAVMSLKTPELSPFRTVLPPAVAKHDAGSAGATPTTAAAAATAAAPQIVVDAAEVLKHWNDGGC